MWYALVMIPEIPEKSLTRSRITRNTKKKKRHNYSRVESSGGCLNGRDGSTFCERCLLAVHFLKTEVLRL